MLTLLPEYPMGPSSSKSGKYCVSPPPPPTPPQLVSALACFLPGAAPWSRTPAPLKLLKTPFQPQLKQHLLYNSHPELEIRVHGLALYCQRTMSHFLLRALVTLFCNDMLTDWPVCKAMEQSPQPWIQFGITCGTFKTHLRIIWLVWIATWAL